MSRYRERTGDRYALPAEYGFVSPVTPRFKYTIGPNFEV